MKRFSSLLFLVLLIACIVSAGFAQEQPAGNITIEELYLSQDVELQIARTQALSNDRATKSLAIQSIRSMVESGIVPDGDPAVLAVLNSLAGEGTTRLVREGGMIVNNFPDIRRAAVALLGDVGGPGAVSSLMQIAQSDNEPTVLAEAVFALAKTADPEDQVVRDQIVRILYLNTASRTPDNNLAYAVLLAVERMAASATLSDPELINALLEAASGNYVRDVRLKAVDVIASLRRRPD